MWPDILFKDDMLGESSDINGSEGGLDAESDDSDTQKRTRRSPTAHKRPHGGQ